MSLERRTEINDNTNLWQEIQPETIYVFEEEGVIYYPKHKIRMNHIKGDEKIPIAEITILTLHYHMVSGRYHTSATYKINKLLNEK